MTAPLPLALVHIPSWGDCRVPVLAIDGDTWTVWVSRTASHPGGVERRVQRAEVNPLCVVAAFVVLEVRQGERSRRVEDMTDRAARLWAASENGLSVRAIENLSET